MHSFRRSLKRGSTGEFRFHAMHPTLIRTDGKVEDFKTLNGKLVELKTESRSTLETPNIAVEMQSSEKRPGALQRAVDDNIDYIVYLFANDLYFCYNPKKLLEYVLAAKVKYRHVDIPNKGYTSVVVLVPRADLLHLETPFEY